LRLGWAGAREGWGLVGGWGPGGGDWLGAGERGGLGLGEDREDREDWGPGRGGDRMGVD